MSAGGERGTFVFVHGAFSGGWCWRDVGDVLTARGHKVFRPSLTGLGDRKHLLDARVDLSTHVADIVNLTEMEDLQDVVLVGHSYAGFVITGAGDRVAERIRALVYIDAFVPDDGLAMTDYWTAEIRQDWDDACAASDGVSRPPLPAKFFGLCGAAADWVDAKVHRPSLRDDAGKAAAERQVRPDRGQSLSACGALSFGQSGPLLHPSPKRSCLASLQPAMRP